MCGIGGLMLFPKDRSVEELKYIRSLARSIALENESRGHDSTGFASFSKKGFSVFKHPLRATKFVNTNEFNKYIAKNINQNTMNVLIHTRAGTKGTELNNLNNHPIETQRFIGIHNGMIWNDDALFEKYKLFRAAEVDSEIIFRLLDSTGDQTNMTDIKWVSEKLTGGFTTAFVPKKHKNKLFLVRNDNPCTMIYVPDLNLIAFASEKRFLVNSFSAANEFAGGLVTISSEDCTWLEPSRQAIYEFDASLDNAEEQLDQEPVRFSENYNYNYWGRGYDEQDFFQNGAAEVTEDQPEKKRKDILAYILSKLTNDEMDVLDEYIDSLGNNAWTEGWRHGRDSIGEEVEQKIGISYEQGFQKGYEDGFFDAGEHSVDISKEALV